MLLSRFAVSEIGKKVVGTPNHHAFSAVDHYARTTSKLQQYFKGRGWNMLANTRPELLEAPAEYVAEAAQESSNISDCQIVLPNIIGGENPIVSKFYGKISTIVAGRYSGIDDFVSDNQKQIELWQNSGVVPNVLVVSGNGYPQNRLNTPKLIKALDGLLGAENWQPYVVFNPGNNRRSEYEELFRLYQKLSIRTQPVQVVLQPPLTERAQTLAEQIIFGVSDYSISKDIYEKLELSTVFLPIPCWSADTPGKLSIQGKITGQYFEWLNNSFIKQRLRGIESGIYVSTPNSNSVDDLINTLEQSQSHLSR